MDDPQSCAIRRSGRWTWLVIAAHTQLRLDERIEQVLAPFAPQLQLLHTIPGV